VVGSKDKHDAIVEKNPLIDDHPELVNEQPYGDGWLVVIELTDPSQVEALMDAAAYGSFIEQGTS